MHMYTTRLGRKAKANKQVNYAQDNSFSKEKRRAALVGLEPTTRTYCTYSHLLPLCISAALVAQWAGRQNSSHNIYVVHLVCRGAKQTYRIACFVCDWHCTYLTCF